MFNYINNIKSNVCIIKIQEFSGVSMVVSVVELLKIKLLTYIKKIPIYATACGGHYENDFCLKPSASYI